MNLVANSRQHCHNKHILRRQPIEMDENQLKRFSQCSPLPLSLPALLPKQKKIADAIPDTTNIPSGLKDASKVELIETGFTLYVDNYNKSEHRSTSERLKGIINQTSSSVNKKNKNLSENF